MCLQSVAPKGKTTITIAADHKVMIDEGVKIVETVDCSVFLNHVPFMVVRTLIVLKLRAFGSRLNAFIVGISLSYVLLKKTSKLTS
jgi:hypothetical protein